MPVAAHDAKNILLVVLHGVTAPQMAPEALGLAMPFWRSMGHPAPVEFGAGRLGDVLALLDLDHPGHGLWRVLAELGLSFGAFNVGRRAAPGSLFFAPRVQAGGGLVTHPPELAADLADYRVGMRHAGRPHRKGRAPKDDDQLFAERAAAARLVYEHADRLWRRFRPRLLAVGFEGPTALTRQGGPSPERASLYLRQIDHYCLSLAQRLGDGPAFLLAAPQVGDGRAGWLLGPGQAIDHPRPLDLAAMMDIIQALATHRPDQGTAP